MTKEKFESIIPTDAAKVEDLEQEKNRQEKIELAQPFYLQIRQIQGAKSLEELDMAELEQVLDLYKQIKDIGSGIAVVPEGKIEGLIEEQIKTAKEVMGTEDVIGPIEVEKAFGVKLKSAEIPKIPFSKEELARAKELGQFLVLRVDKMEDGKPFTLENLKAVFDKTPDGDNYFYAQKWYETENKIYKEDTPGLEWALTSKEVIPDSTDKNYLEQTEKIVKYLEGEVFKGKALPKEYQKAIALFRSLSADEKSDRSKYEPKISKLNELTRQSPIKALYDLFAYYKNNNKKLLEKMYTRTHTMAADGDRVFIGSFGADGVIVNRDSDDDSVPRLGVVFSRKS